MATAAIETKIQIGEVFTERVSYEATLIIFHTVINVSSTGKTITVQQCSRTIIDDHKGGNLVAPNPETPMMWPRTGTNGNQLFELAPIETKRVRHFNDRYSFKTYGGRAYLDDTPRLDTMKNH